MKKLNEERKRKIITVTTIVAFLCACFFMALSEREAEAAWIDRGQPFYNNIYALATAPDGSIWAAGEYGATARWDDEKWQYTGGWPYGTRGIRAIGVAKDGSIWIAGDYGYTARWNGTEWEGKGQALSDNLYAITVGNDGKIYVAGYTGEMAYWGGSAWVNVGVWPYTSTTIKAMTTDKNGNIWAVGASGHAAYWNGSSWVSTPQVPHSQELRAVSVASDGSIWAAGTLGYVYRWNGSEWEVKGQYRTNHIEAMTVSSDGCIWTADNYGYVTRYNNGTWEDMGSWPAGTNAIYAMTAGNDGTVWVAGAAGNTAQYTPVDVGTPQLSYTQDGQNVTLTWTAVTGADKYELQRSADGTNFTTIAETTETTYQDTISGGTFYYRVRGKTSLGFAGSWSNVVSVTYNPPPPPPPPQPAKFIAYWVGDKIRVEWSAGDQELPSGTIELVRKTTGSEQWLTVKTLSDAEKASFTWDDVMVLAGLNYEYQLRTLGDYDSDYNWQVIADSGWATGDRPFSAPSSLRVSLGQNSATVTWEAVSGTTSYTVQYSTNGGTTWQGFTVTGTSANVPRHCIARVRAGNHSRSQWSGNVTVP